MKVTVNFGAVRVIVPCGRGDLPVKQLMDLAITRYKKATGKSLDSWVTIHNLKISSDGGILDPDDTLSDVADDREQIIAVFDEECSPFLPHNGGDGTSASSVGTESPDIFQNHEIIPLLSKPHYNGSDVEITAENVSSGIIPLQVRRGSEPALNQISPVSLTNTDTSKRWSAAIIVDGSLSRIINSEGENSEQSEDEPPPGEREDGSGEEKCSPDQIFDNSSVYSAVDSTLDGITWKNDLFNQPRRDKRREPLGGPRTSPTMNICEDKPDKKSLEVVKLKNEDGPLGIHVVPGYDSPEKNFGLVIQGIEPGGRVDRDGRFSIGDRITEINGFPLNKESFQKAQEIFKDALKAPEISLQCVKNNTILLPQLKESPLSSLVKSPSCQKTENERNDLSSEEGKKSCIPMSVTSTPSRKSPSIMIGRCTPSHSSIRKIGRRILIHLKKGSEGLGFSISSKDAMSSSPLFVKNILPAGAAVEDGRLKVGDKLMEVNNTDVTNMTQSEVVNLLRQIPFGEIVELIVSRQDVDHSPSPNLPRELPPEKAGDEVGIFPWKNRDVFTFDIPLNDTGSAGLGVSVKGKTCTMPSGAMDMGIFVKSVIHGGAASKDGRLCTNDQLLNINGISLLAMTNGQAMETLRRAMIQGEGPKAIPNAITLTVARRIPSPGPDGYKECSDSACHERSDSLLSESGDSFHVSAENLSYSSKIEGVTPETSTSENSGNTVIFVSESQVNSSINDSANTQNEQESDNISSVVCKNSPLLEQLIKVKDSEFREKLSKGKHYFHPDSSNQTEQVIAGDLNSDKQHFICGMKHQDTNYMNSQRENENFIHYKSLSNPVNLEKSSTLNIHSKSYKKSHNGSDNSLCHRSKAVQPDHTTSADVSSFSRNGYGRQSMPEKSLVLAVLEENRISERIKNKCGNRSELSYQNFCTPRSKSMHPSRECEVPPREMPVDVGPSKAHVKLQPNEKCRNQAPSVRERQNPNHMWPDFVDSSCSSRNVRSRVHPGSCHSPGCPYHAVPSSERESGSSGETSTQVGPSLGMCKSSSLESLQTMVHELQRRDVTLCSISKDGGSRTCNESFRAAVDRSYESQVYDEETVQEQKHADKFGHCRSKTGSPIPEISKKKKKRIFKGLGAVFRFGKTNKKNNQETSTIEQKTDNQKEMERLHAPKSTQDEPNRIEECCRKLEQKNCSEVEILKSCPMNEQNDSNYYVSPELQRFSPFLNQMQHYEHPTSPSYLQNRQKRMHLLRAQHQLRHIERKGFYPQEEQAEKYEEQIQRIMDNKVMCKRPLPPIPHQKLLSRFNESNSQGNGLDPTHSESFNFDIYKEMSKPGSRMGFADPDRFSHYMNFQEIQQHLQQFRPLGEFQGGISHEKHRHILDSQHPSQCDSRNSRTSKYQYSHTVGPSRSRPISNFFEYESAHTIKLPKDMKSDAGTGSLPRRAFASSRQRLPIPTYMMNDRNISSPNSYNAQSINQNMGFNESEHSDIYYAKKYETPGSKV